MGGSSDEKHDLLPAGRAEVVLAKKIAHSQSDLQVVLLRIPHPIALWKRLLGSPFGVASTRLMGFSSIGITRKTTHPLSPRYIEFIASQIFPMVYPALS
jgi:hypothetical protein